MPTITLLTAIFCVFVGGTVLWANPRRFANQAFFAVSSVLATWLLAVFQAMLAFRMVSRGEWSAPILWLRANAAVAAFFPLVMMLIKQAISSDASTWRQTLVSSRPWLTLGVFLASLCYADSFILGPAPSGAYIRGAAYYTYIVILFCFFALFTAHIWKQTRTQSGIRRIEMQFLTLTLCLMSLSIVGLAAAGNYFRIRVLSQSTVLTISVAYVFLAWAIAYHRIFDARQVFLGFAQRISLIVLLSFGVLGLWRVANAFLPEPADLIVSLLVGCSVAFWLDRKSRAWLRLDGEAALQELRQPFIELARTVPHPEQLLAEFETLLCERCQTPFSALLLDRGTALAAGNIALSKDRSGYAVLCAAGWATPENLQRRRPTPGIDDLRAFLAQHSLGLVVIAPRGTPQPALVLALGVKTTLKPFTYPEVQRLQNVAELIDNVLAHARLTAQAALEAKMEHLALMSRGLAHDLKNLLTPVSSFLVHTDGRYERGSAEAEVHGEAKRSVRLMTNYVREALFFSNRLDPHFEETDLERVFTTVRDASAARALERGVTIALAAGVPRHLTADAVLLERLLGNLINNAIDASAPGKTVTLRCVEPEPGRVRFEVVDDGCGIPPENLTHIFEPYFTTKQFGDDVRGFGLGLTICEKIVNLHQGTILVRSEPGRGTHVTVDLPAAPSAFLPAPPSAAAA